MMSKHAFRLAFCLLALVAPAAVPVQAETAPFLTYTQSGVGGTMDQACTNAAEKIKDNCAVHGPITTDPGRCLPLLGPDGSVIGQVCTCEASTSFCAVFRPL
jgi:hypothetical protein